MCLILSRLGRALPCASINFAEVLVTKKKGHPGLYPGVPCVSCHGAKSRYCPAPAGFSAGFFGAAATELPALGFQKSSALTHSAGAELMFGVSANRLGSLDSRAAA